jgi:hypothetical protein
MKTNRYGGLETLSLCLIAYCLQITLLCPIFVAMTGKSTPAQPSAESSRSAGVPRYTPRSLSIHSRWRFGRRRKTEYLAQISGEPSPWQVAAIESLIRREWLTMLAERRDDADQALRADFAYQKLAADFRRSLPQPTPAPQPTLTDILSGIAARRRAQPEPEEAA